MSTDLSAGGWTQTPGVVTQPGPRGQMTSASRASQPSNLLIGWLEHMLQIFQENLWKIIYKFLPCFSIKCSTCVHFLIMFPTFWINSRLLMKLVEKGRLQSGLVCGTSQLACLFIFILLCHSGFRSIRTQVDSFTGRFVYNWVNSFAIESICTLPCQKIWFLIYYRNLLILGEWYLTLC